MENNLISIKAQKEEEGLSFDIELKWEERKVEDEARVGAMYCFKACGVNKN
jgi:hypothetical protein